MVRAARRRQERWGQSSASLVTMTCLLFSSISLRLVSSVAHHTRRTALRASAGLARWRAAVERVPAGRVLPPGFGGTDAASTAAWHGDRVLGAAIAAEMRARGVEGKQRLADASAAAVSNRNLASKLDDLLPAALLELVPHDQRMIQEHACGSLVEACVHEVHQSGDHDAVAEMAAFLLEDVTETSTDNEAAQLTTKFVNDPKGKLLNLGGSVTSERTAGPCERPIFSACATYSDLTAQGAGNTKKAAEQQAAAEVLRISGVNIATQPNHRKHLDVADKQGEQEATYGSPETSLDQLRGPLRWEPIGGDRDLVANLKNGESEVEWFRRKCTLHRCLCAPCIFPEVQSVRAWRCAFEEGTACLMRVASVADGSPHLFLSPRLAPSNTKAEQLASSLAQKHILALVQHENDGGL